jgi:hypothetical protein
MTDQATSMSVHAEADPHAAHAGHGRGWWGFGRHYLEMVAAMLPGCAVGCVLWGAFLTTWADTSGLTTIAMALLMAATMGAWMRYRRHLWSSVVEMSASMVVVPVVLIPLLWVGEISSLTIHGATMLAMLPAMFAVMFYRRKSYLG